VPSPHSNLERQRGKRMPFRRRVAYLETTLLKRENGTLQIVLHGVGGGE